MKRPVVLTIAGHDPSGGAGVTADQRVIESLGCVAVTLVTALTVQNTSGVQAIEGTPREVLTWQLDALFSDCEIAALKIGMLERASQIRVVARALRRHKACNIVLDPVLASTGGVKFLGDLGIDALLDDIVPQCGVITPNLDEASRLTGLEVRDINSMCEAGRILLRRGARCVVIKGGHLSGDPADVVLVDGAEPVVLSAPRISTPHTHGTGCFLSSAIAAHLALGKSVLDAIILSRDALRSALGSPIVIGRGRGYPGVGFQTDHVK